MTGTQHLSFNMYSMLVLCIGIVVGKFFSWILLILIFVGSLIGCLLPDIDEKHSNAGKVLPFYILGKIFKKNKMLKHMGITHTYFVNLWILLSAFLIDLAQIFGEYSFVIKYLLVGISVGYLTHIYADDIDGDPLKNKWWPFDQYFFEEPKTKRKKRK